MQVLGTEYLLHTNARIELLAIGGILFGLSAILGLIVGPQAAILAELFPVRSRNSAGTVPYNLGAGWIGGPLPLIVTWLNQELRSDIAGL